MLISGVEAAQRLCLSERRIRSLVAAGRIHGERVGGRWLLDDASVALFEPRQSRALSPRNAWGLIELLDGERSADLSPAEVSRLRKKRRELLASEDPASLLRSWLGRRAERQIYRASSRDLASVRRDVALRPSGLSDPRSGLASARVVEGYVEESDVAELVQRHLLVSASDGRGNVILHVTDRRLERIPVALLAADLADHRSPRENGQAEELVGNLA